MPTRPALIWKGFGMGRSKSGKYIPGEHLAFPVFGDIRPFMDRFILPVWVRDVPEPHTLLFPTLEMAVARKALLIENSLDVYLAGIHAPPEFNR